MVSMNYCKIMVSMNYCKIMVSMNYCKIGGYLDDQNCIWQLFFARKEMKPCTREVLATLRYKEKGCAYPGMVLISLEPPRSLVRLLLSPQEKNYTRVASSCCTRKITKQNSLSASKCLRNIDAGFLNGPGKLYTL
jgi:hypothetical protein